MLASKILHLYPNASPLSDFRVRSINGVETIEFWSVALGAEPSQATLDAVTQGQIDSSTLTKAYTRAKALLTSDDDISRKDKAVLLTILDELNLHATKINDILTAIDGAATLAAMKTAIAAINDYPQRTAAQLRTAANNKIDAGEANG